jgi:hypothetical protein
MINIKRLSVSKEYEKLEGTYQGVIVVIAFAAVVVSSIQIIYKLIY